MAFKKIVGVLIAIVTLITTVVAYFQNDAGNRDDQAGRDANRLMVEILGKQIEGNARVNYDYDKAYQAWYELGSRAFASGQRDDLAGQDRLTRVRERLRDLSPFMQAPYFNESDGTINYPLYATDVYLNDVTRMQEEFTAAASVKDMWDSKANTYIVHITILAVSLFLLGLSATVELQTKWIFVGVGVVMASVGTVWAGATYAQPVFDLRTIDGAIDAYAKGTSLATQGLYADAIQSFDTAIQLAPDYANAYTERASSQSALGNYDLSIADTLKARELGKNEAFTLGNLAYIYYLNGQFEPAIATNREALETGKADLWVQFDLGLALLVNGQVDDAQKAYQDGLAVATQIVTQANATGETVPSDIWYSLNDASTSLQTLLYVIDSGEGEPKRDLLVNPDALTPIANDLIRQLKSYTVSLEFNGVAPQGELTANLTEVAVGEPLYDENNTFTEYNYADEYPLGVKDLDLLFHYDGMRDGQNVVVKTYLNGNELPTWRYVTTWDAGTSGDYYITLAISFSDTFILSSGFYDVEIYVDGLLASTTSFLISE